MLRRRLVLLLVYLPERTSSLLANWRLKMRYLFSSCVSWFYYFVKKIIFLGFKLIANIMIKRIKLLGLFVFGIWFEQINNVLKYWTLIWKRKKWDNFVVLWFWEDFSQGRDPKSQQRVIFLPPKLFK